MTDEPTAFDAALNSWTVEQLEAVKTAQAEKYKQDRKTRAKRQRKFTQEINHMIELIRVQYEMV